MDMDCSMGSVDITTYYSKDSYEYDIDTDMGNSSFDGNGGMQSDTVHKVKIEIFHPARIKLFATWAVFQ